ncbi:MAG: CHRD domain-containing protein [Bacteroidota bacterium]
MKKQILFLIWLFFLNSIPSLFAQSEIFNVYLSPRNVVPPVRNGQGLGDMRISYDSANCSLNFLGGSLRVEAGDTIQDVILQGLRPGQARFDIGIPPALNINSTVMFDPAAPHKATIGFGSSINFSSDNDAVALKTAFSKDAISVVVYTKKGGVVRGAIRGALGRDFGVSGLASYTANTYGSNVAPPIISDAKGSFEAFTVQNNLLITGTVKMENVEERFVMATLRTGKPGEKGQVLDTLTAKIDTVNDCVIFNLRDNGTILNYQQQDLLGRGMFHIAIHTQEHPMGEIRDQLQIATSSYRTRLTGLHADRRTCSGGNGQVTLFVERDSILNVVGVINDLGKDFAEAAIYCGAPGQPGTKLFDLTFGPDFGSTTSGTFDPFFNRYVMDSLTQAKLRQGLLYVYISTASFDTKTDLRGHIFPESQIRLEGFFSGDQAVPPTRNQTTGEIAVSITDTVVHIEGSVNPSNPGDTLAPEVVFGLPGKKGTTALPLTALGDTFAQSAIIPADQNRFSITSTEVSNFVLGNAAIVCRGDTFAEEVRANIGIEANQAYYASIFGTGTSPTNETDASGGIHLWKNGNQITLAGSISGVSGGIDSEGGLTIGTGFFGDTVASTMKVAHREDPVSGDISVSADTVYQLPGSQDDSIKKMLLGVSVKRDFVLEEILGGTFTSAEGISFYANLKGSNEVDPVRSPASGKVLFNLFGNTLIYAGKVENLKGKTMPDGSRIYMGAAGSNGSEVGEMVGLFPGGNPKTVHYHSLNGEFDNFIELTMQQVAALKAGLLYMNISTDSFPEGEIRGQILPLSNEIPTEAPTLNSSTTIPSLNTFHVQGFDLSWSAGLDNNEQKNYLLEIGTNPMLSNPAIFVNVPAATTYSLQPNDIFALDAALLQQMVATGDTAILYGRISLSDGSECKEGMIVPFEVIRLSPATGISRDQFEDISFNFFPNPVRDILHLSFESPSRIAGSLTVLDITGKQLYKEVITLSPGPQQHSLFLHQLSDGFYQLVIEIQGKGILTEKLIIRR